ncbi:AarF/ABC1/UbiB kinase family protein [Propioniciclava coleopterorum]|uniref:AarF/ABC1/UbiB kinase family protein n=1 Tax=Propioniciclava coleopterorum TaxID=2714937 RepID=A0A6G7Y461_9ACTN|nr:AarF/UbiB family protein [Propioniciclava coleopterorum]QIK71610.1 AarF/ABC1/UbiB kinase family protein [Propioniciclava coleopterorum]
MDVLAVLGSLANGFGALVGGVLQAWLLVHAARRVLGVPVGWIRAFLVSFVTLGIFFAVVTWLLESGTVAITDANGGAVMAVLAVAALWAFAFSAAVLVGLEVLWPTGSLPPLRTWLFGWKRRLATARRSAQISAILARHGLGSQLRGLAASNRPAQTARSLRLALQDSGVTFVKLGQMLSTRADLMPPVFIAELSHLTNRVPPQPWPVFAETVTTELGRPLDEVFASIEEEPLASASLAQVHTARLLDGQEVVVKAQRASASDQVALDLEILRRLARRLERSAPWARRLGVAGLVEGFADSLDEELDYGVELDNMAALRPSADARGIRIPQVDASLCSSRLIVMERLTGTPIAQASDLIAGLDADVRAAAAQRLLAAVLGQLLDDGIFHADLHPGNVVIWDDGSVGLLDFGSVGRLDAPSRQTLAMLLWAIDADDPVLATDCVLELLDRPDRLDERGLQRELGQLITRYRGGLGRGGSLKVFSELLSMVMRHGFGVPPQIAAALRSLGALEGTLKQLDPGLDLVDAARTVAREVTGDLTPETVRAQVERRLIRVLPVLEHLPRRVDKLTEDLTEGRFTVRVRAFSDPADRHFLTGLVQQLVLALLSGASVLGGILLVTTAAGPQLLPGLGVFALLGYLLAFAGLVLALRAVALIFTRPG